MSSLIMHFAYDSRGGWVGCKILADAVLASNYLSLAIPHPSVQLEQMVFGGDTQALVDQVQRPVLFMPAKVIRRAACSVVFLICTLHGEELL